MNDHRRLDQRSLALHSAIADLILHKPEAIDRALSNLSRWETTVAGSWIAEWRELLLGPRGALLLFLTERSERADRLRQSSPFAGVLSETVRRRILNAYAVGVDETKALTPRAGSTTAASP